jgi:multiple antibiotic resistance protein
MEQALSFLHLVFVGYVALFPPVNPIGTALVVEPLLNPLDRSQRKAASFKIALYCFGICASTLAAGSWLFSLFGISLPIVQVAGGIMICRMGWQFLSADEKKNALPSGVEGGADVGDVLFYPVAFPMTTGAGTISVILTLSAHGHNNGLGN